MNRTDLINYFIHHRGATRYLEICTHDEQHNLVHIHCRYKAITFPKTTTNFFRDNNQDFDIIFIDGVHTEEAVLEDIACAKQSLAPGGVIILHDCMPPDAWHQREIEAYREGENWNGTVWKAALRVFNSTAFKCTLLDTDWGCGIIDAARTQIPECLMLPEHLSYELHYAWLLKYRKSVADYLRAGRGILSSGLYGELAGGI